jgi:hypothetical protein
MSRAAPLCSFSALLVALVGVGCVEPAVDRIGDRTAVIPHTDAFLGLSRDGDDALLYVCDGHNGQVTTATWLRGTFVNGVLTAQEGTIQVQLRESDDDSVLAGSIHGLVGLGNSAPFELAPKPAPDGLYQMQDSESLTGWVVVDGEQRGARLLLGGASATPTGRPDGQVLEPAEELHVAANQSDDLRL